MQYALRPFSLVETAEYLDFRLSVVGGAPGLFLPEAVERLYRFSAGVPRRINHIAALALLEGFGREARRIGPEILDALTEELALTGRADER